MDSEDKKLENNDNFVQVDQESESSIEDIKSTNNERETPETIIKKSTPIGMIIALVAVVAALYRFPTSVADRLVELRVRLKSSCHRVLLVI